jgi:hypothetical protein
MTSPSMSYHLLIVGCGCGLSVSERRFHSVSFPGLKGNSTAKCNRLLDCEQAYNAIDSKSGTRLMAVGLWQVGLWQEGGQAAYSQGQFRSVFSVKLFVELSRPRPDFIDILTPIDASSADVDWIRAELSRGDRYPSRFIKSLTQAREQPSGKQITT